jgi:hypothetical protein
MHQAFQGLDHVIVKHGQRYGLKYVIVHASSHLMNGILRKLRGAGRSFSYSGIKYVPIIFVPVANDSFDVNVGHPRDTLSGAVNEAERKMKSEWNSEQMFQKSGLPPIFENPMASGEKIGLAVLAIGAVVGIGVAVYEATKSGSTSPNSSPTTGGQVNFKNGYRYNLTIHSSQPLPQVPQGQTLTAWWQSQLDALNGPGAFQITNVAQTSTTDVVITADCTDTTSWTGQSPVTFTITPGWTLSIGVSTVGPTPIQNS